MPILDYIAFCAAYWNFVLAFFLLVQKPLFGLYNRKGYPGGITRRDITAVYSHGFRSDAIAASYLTPLAALAALVQLLTSTLGCHIPLLVINIAGGTACALASVADTALYPFWKSKLDKSALVYLRSLKGATASVSGAYVTGFIASAVAFAALWAWGAQTVCTVFAQRAHTVTGFWPGLGCVAAFIVLLGLLFLIIRGTGIRPVNPGKCYFSPVSFLNHWALNPLYGFVYTLSLKDEYSGEYRFFDSDAECDRILAPYFPTSGTPLRKLLKTDRPDILLIIWESLGAEFCGATGGRPEVTPCLNALAREGVLWGDVRAGSFRTDRGLACILSGLPGQPLASVVRHSAKLPKLPGLPRRLRDAGYSTTAVHGGDLSIMHKNDYYLAVGHDHLVGESDLPKEAAKTKWGIHDGDVMEWLYNEITTRGESGSPWMITLQTLSSHEPFDVPYSRLDDKVDNSFAYTDACLGQLIDRLKASQAWDNLLIVVTADHGFNSVQNPDDRESYCHIPVVLAGGAVAGPAVINTPASQTDIAATLLGQLGMTHEEFIFSRDITADTYRKPTGINTFNNGFLVRDPDGTTIYDHTAGRVMSGADSGREAVGKALLQKLHKYLAGL